MAFYTSDSLKAKLKQQGFRLTPQRQTILTIFQTLPQGKHLSAEELQKLLELREEKISLATIYRTLKLMARMGILRELELAEGHKHYEINPPAPQHHHHLVCVQCYKTVEFTNEAVLKISRKQAQASKYEMLDCQMTLHVICPEALAQGWPSTLPSDWICPRSGWREND